jgi:glycerol kinase
LPWHLTGGQEHATDATNASRTMLFNIYDQCWDEERLQLSLIPAALLPEVKDCAADFGVTPAGLFARPLPICGIAGDQQAATIGQACFHEGMIKSTYDAGCFALLNTGSKAILLKNRLLSTIAYRIDGLATYALEGSIFIAGAAVQWLRDSIKLIDNAAETEALARQLESNRGIYLVPAFTGLGAPYC